MTPVPASVPASVPMSVFGAKVVLRGVFTSSRHRPGLVLQTPALGALGFRGTVLAAIIVRFLAARCNFRRRCGRSPHPVASVSCTAVIVLSNHPFASVVPSAKSSARALPVVTPTTPSALFTLIRDLLKIAFVLAYLTALGFLFVLPMIGATGRVGHAVCPPPCTRSCAHVVGNECALEHAGQKSLVGFL
eukprot:m.158318 g.158318  ORF g.158318 m.158318 type:complete len:190 (+) comp17598_c0_seq3:101-670(+)